MKFLPILLLLLTMNLLALSTEIDLEANCQEFILETKKIEIPGYPNAFNPSIIRWNNSILMTFREIPNPKSKYDSLIGIVWLDEEFNIVSEPQILDIQGDSLVHSRAEDARLINVDNRLFMVYSDNRDKEISKGGFRVYIAELTYDGERFILNNQECLSKYEGASPKKREKNWVPFIYQDQLLLAYSIEPHTIFLPLSGTGSCQTFMKTDQALDWEWGELRGGTQGFKINDHEYLSFFHSVKEMATVHSNQTNVLHYFMGAYTFSSEPPFEITKISPEPIVGKGFYKGPIYTPYWHPVRVVFPCGFIFDEDFIWISYGRQDHESWIVKLDRKGLISSLRYLR